MTSCKTDNAVAVADQNDSRSRRSVALSGAALAHVRLRVRALIAMRAQLANRLGFEKKKNKLGIEVMDRKKNDRWVRLISRPLPNSSFHHSTACHPRIRYGRIGPFLKTFEKIVEQGERDATSSNNMMMDCFPRRGGHACWGDENVSELGRQKGGRISNRSEVRALISRWRNRPSGVRR